MSERKDVDRRGFIHQSLAAAGSMGLVAGSAGAAEGANTSGKPAEDAAATKFPCGTIGKLRLSRVLLGGNLISGFMHSRDLKYVNSLFRAYATEEKILETLKVAEEHGINTVFETGANFVQRYNRERGGHMQFIPHIKVDIGDSDEALAEHVKRQVDSGAAALYVWGISGDQLVMHDKVDRLAKAVELAKKHGLPVGVGGHSLQVPMACEKHGVPCDFYVKTLHRDDYPSAIPKELRKEFIWYTGGKGYYDNMWCLNPEETVAFMKTVTKPWIAFKVLAAGAYLPRDGFQFAFKSGADFIAVGMLDFQVRANCETARQMIRRFQNRDRPWCA
jgi:hypothetical protein